MSAATREERTRADKIIADFEGEHGRESSIELKAACDILEHERDNLGEALRDTLECLDGCMVFITSRQKINAQEGPGWIAGMTAKARAALAKNPNPSGQVMTEASPPLSGEASGPVGLGPAHPDSARLDWMATHLHRIGEIYLSGEPRPVDCHAWAISSARNDLREAIDAAMGAAARSKEPLHE